MTDQELGIVCATVLASWPRSAWPEATVNVARSMLRELDYEAARRAVKLLVEEGRETAPPPGVVWRLATSVQREIRPQLPAAEAAPSDWERARQRLKEIRRQLDEIAHLHALNQGGKK